MVKRLKKENVEFCGKWSEKRKVGFKTYYFNGALRLLGFMLLLYVVQVAIDSKMNYFLVASVYFGMTLLLPIFSWRINEFRYINTKDKFDF